MSGIETNLAEYYKLLQEQTDPKRLPHVGVDENWLIAFKDRHEEIRARLLGISQEETDISGRFCTKYPRFYIGNTSAIVEMRPCVPKYYQSLSPLSDAEWDRYTIVPTLFHNSKHNNTPESYSDMASVAEMLVKYALEERIQAFVICSINNADKIYIPNKIA